MVQLIRKPKHRATTNIMAVVRSEWRCLVNWLSYFAFKTK